MPGTGNSSQMHGTGNSSQMHGTVQEMPGMRRKRKSEEVLDSTLLKNPGNTLFEKTSADCASDSDSDYACEAPTMVGEPPNNCGAMEKPDPSTPSDNTDTDNVSSVKLDNGSSIHISSTTSSAKTTPALKVSENTPVHADPGEARSTFKTDVRSTLSRCEDVTPQTPEGIRKKYKVSVTLDPDTAHLFLALSEEGRCVTWTRREQWRPGNPKRFTVSRSVLGREGFSSGRHYWELRLLREGAGWAVGVVRESVSRKEVVRLSPEEGVWAVRYNGQYWALSSPLSLSRRPLKLGLYLDYEGGRLSMYNADTMEEIHTFTGAAFTGTVHPYFRLWKGSDLRLL